MTRTVDLEIPGRLKVARDMGAVERLIRERTPFRTRIRKHAYGTFISMSGVRHDFGMHLYDTGHLPIQYHAAASMADFIVYSYDTPIAWHTPVLESLDDVERVEAWLAGEDFGVWVIPDVRYTRTTTQHVSHVNGALGGWGWGVRDGETTKGIRFKQLRLPDAPARVEYVGCSREGY